MLSIKTHYTKCVYLCVTLNYWVFYVIKVKCLQSYAWHKMSNFVDCKTIQTTCGIISDNSVFGENHAMFVHLTPVYKAGNDIYFERILQGFILVLIYHEWLLI